MPKLHIAPRKNSLDSAKKKQQRGEPVVLLGVVTENPFSQPRTHNGRLILIHYIGVIHQYIYTHAPAESINSGSFSPRAQVRASTRDEWFPHLPKGWLSLSLSLLSVCTFDDVEGP